MTAEKEHGFLHSGTSQDTSQDEEWERIKGLILTRLCHRGEPSYRSLARDLLSQVSQVQSSLARCAFIIAALLVGVRGIGRMGMHPIAMLLKMPLGRTGLSRLVRLALDLVLAHPAYRSGFGDLRNAGGKYELSLQQLPEEKLERLEDFTRQVAAALEAAKSERR